MRYELADLDLAPLGAINLMLVVRPWLLLARFIVICWAFWAIALAFGAEALAATDGGPPDAAPQADGANASEAAISDASTSDAPAAATMAEEAPIPRLSPNEAEKAEGLPIVRIEIKNGGGRLPEAEVRGYLHVKLKDIFSTEALASDVRALWESKFFSDIKVDLTRSDTGVILRFILHERPNIREIAYTGNDELDESALNETVEIKTNTALNHAALRRSSDRIKEAYREKGYFLANVDFSIVEYRDNEVGVTFKITEGNQVTVQRITIIGNDHIPEADLRDVMETGQGSFFSFGSYKQSLLERDILLMSALYYDRGYLDVRFSTPRVMLTPDREGLDIMLVLNEGPRYKIRQLLVTEVDEDGKEVDPLGGRRSLRQLISAQPGDWVNRSAIQKDLQAVKTKYRDAGYANVEAEPRVEIDRKTNAVDVQVRIRRGPLVTIERIEIKGNVKTRDKVLRREFEIAEGKLFSETALEDSRRRTLALGFFDRVDVSTAQGSDPTKIVVTFDVNERSTGQFNVGAGFSSIETFIATATVNQQNLFGNGQALSLQASISGLRQLISLRIYEPYFLDSDWSFSTELFNQYFIFNDFARLTRGASITFGYAIVQPSLRLGVTLTAQHDSVDNAAQGTFFGATSAANLQPRAPLANLYTSGRTISVRPTITYDSRDNRIFPTSGMFLQASSEFASSIFASELEFIRHRLTTQFYVPLGGNSGQPGSGFVLKMRNDFGVVTSPNDVTLPIYARFFLGGIFDMRGYRLRSIGPRLPVTSSLDPNSSPIPNGFVIGGNLQAYTNIEFEFPILDKVGIRGVAFFDVGNAWNLESRFCKTAPAPQFARVVSPCFDGSSLFFLRTSAGFGVRWFSPLGPLRFELGIPLMPLSYEEKSVFEFTIGNSF